MLVPFGPFRSKLSLPRSLSGETETLYLYRDALLALPLLDGVTRVVPHDLQLKCPAARTHPPQART